MAGLALIAAPSATDPLVTLEEAQAHLRSSEPEEADLVEALIAAATTHAEAFCRRKFVSQQWRAYFDHFPSGSIVLPFPPLASVQSVKYMDLNGDLQTLATADYVVRTTETPGEIRRAYGVYWPTARAEPDAVRVEFTCGYGAASAVPDAVKRAVMLMVGTWYAQRETVVTGTIATALPQSAEYLLGPHRVLRMAG